MDQNAKFKSNATKWEDVQLSTLITILDLVSVSQTSTSTSFTKWGNKDRTHHLSITTKQILLWVSLSLWQLHTLDSESWNLNQLWLIPLIFLWPLVHPVNSHFLYLWSQFCFLQKLLFSLTTFTCITIMYIFVRLSSIPPSTWLMSNTTTMVI